MAWQTWVIIALVALSYFQYASPEKTNDLLDPIWGNVKDFIDAKNPLSSNDDSTDSSNCPDVDNPVCGSDGVTYKSMCHASEAGIMQATYGECS